MCIDVIGLVHPLETELDDVAFQHVIYALNKVFLILRDGNGFNKQTIVEGGKVLFRLSRIIQAYADKKNRTNISVEEFTKRLLKVVDNAHSIFVGGVIPRVW